MKAVQKLKLVLRLSKRQGTHLLRIAIPCRELYFSAVFQTFCSTEYFFYDCMVFIFGVIQCYFYNTEC